MKEASLQETVVENVFLMVSGDLHALVESALSFTVKKLLQCDHIDHLSDMISSFFMVIK